MIKGKGSPGIKTGDPFYPEQNIYINPDDNFDSYCVAIHNITKEQVANDAKDFIDSKIKRLSKAQELIQDQDVSLVCTIDGDTLGVNWKEGISWLEEVLRQAFYNNEIEIEFLSDLIRDNHFSLQKIKP